MSPVLLLFTLSLSLLFSCGGKNSSKGKRVTRIAEEEIQEVMNNQKFSCASLSGGCPHGVARLLVLNRFDPDQSAVCSGFMVGETTLMTNHHCVDTKEVCSDTYIAIYTGATYVQTKCKRIIKTMQDTPDPNDPSRRLDFTVLEIEDVYHDKFFEVSDVAAEIGDTVHSWVVDHTGLDDEIRPNLYDSRITEFRCNVMDQNEYASLMLERCAVINGNSGSVSLNTDGHVIGIIWGGSAFGVDTTLELPIRRSLNFEALLTEAENFRAYIPSIE